MEEIQITATLSQRATIKKALLLSGINIINGADFVALVQHSTMLSDSLGFLHEEEKLKSSSPPAQFESWNHKRPFFPALHSHFTDKGS